MMAVSIFQPGIEVQSLYSKILHQDFELYIKLPWSYGRGDGVYPVLIALDGNRSFPLYSTMSLIYETPGTSSEEIIIVGIGYKLDEDRMKGLAQWAAWRTRDMTPARRESTEQFWKEKLSKLPGGAGLEIRSGGAALFLQSLREEVIPFVEANYRLSSAGRGLAGYSYGGLFTLYTLFQAPELFRHYFAGSPTMWEQLYEYEEKYASAHDNLKAQVFITAGSLENDLLISMDKLTERMRTRGYTGLELKTHVFEGEGHSSAYAASVSRALRVLYRVSED